MIIDINQAETCYILGYFWADCFLGPNAFMFEIKTDDFILLRPIFENLGMTKFSTRTRKNSKNSQSSVKFYKKEELKFFKENGFDKKKERCELYFKLSDEMKPFFIKGFLDGDGCISYITKDNHIRVSFNGAHSQNWDFLEDFLIKHNIPYKIYNKTRPSHDITHKKLIHSYSVMELCGLQNKVNFCKLIDDIPFGVQRKIQVFRDFKEYRIGRSLEEQKHSQFLDIQF